MLDDEVQGAIAVEVEGVAVPESGSPNGFATWKPSRSYTVTDQIASTGGSSAWSKWST